MSGRRCKALRAHFAHEYGRPPEKTTVLGQEGGVFSARYRYQISEWRRWKARYKALRSGRPWVPAVGKETS